MKRSIRALIFALAMSAATGCGGSSSGAPPSATQQLATVNFTVVLPQPAANAARRSPRYVSAATQSASIIMTPNGGSAGAPTVVNCTTVCSAQIQAAVGSDTFAVTLFAGQNATGAPLSTGTLTQTIVLNQANAITVTLDGIVASLAVSLSPNSLPSGTAATSNVTVNALDAAGDIIIAPGVYANASGTPITVTLTNSDDLGATTLSQTTLTAPTTGITLQYNGITSPTITITASAPSATSGSATLSFTTSFGPVVLNPSSLNFLATGANYTQTTTASQTGFSGTFTTSTPPAGQPNSCSGIATIAPQSPPVFAITPVGAGSCYFTFTGGGGQTANLTVGVTTTTVGGQ
jgi:hypothetical protein